LVRSNEHLVCGCLTRFLALFRQKGELPYSTRRTEQEKLNPAVKKAKAQLKQVGKLHSRPSSNFLDSGFQMFKEDFTFEYDILSIFKALHERAGVKEGSEEHWFRRYGSYVPNMLTYYVGAVVEGLEDKKFGSGSFAHIIL
jgi:hypothetical protein